MSVSPEVIVIGGSHHNALGVVRALGRKGIKSFFILIGKKNSYITKSKYLKGWKALYLEDMIPFLQDYPISESDKSIIIVCHDGVAELLERNRDKLSGRFILPGSQAGKILELMDKQTQTLTAAKFGFNIPMSVVVTDVDKADISAISFPCITKPGKSILGGKRDIRIFRNPDALKEFLSYKRGIPIQIQDFIDVDFEFQLIGASYNGGEEIIIPGVSHILRPQGGTNTQFLKYSAMDESFTKTALCVKDFLKSLGYSGLFSAEFLRGKDGNDYFLEVNFRNDGNTIVVTNSGANLPYWWVMRTAGDAVETPQLESDQYLLPEHRELSLLRKRAISFADLREDMRKTTCFAKYAQDDPQPTRGKLYFYAELLWSILSRPFSKPYSN